MARPVSANKAIPQRVYINDISDINGSYSSTPGGTLFSTTPGGTKIVYEKSILMNLRNSPISKTPPKWDIPHNIQKGSKFIRSNNQKDESTTNRYNIGRAGNDDNEQFQLEI